MSDDWKKHDRERPPCPNCGAELYEKFWGNGGWVKTDKATGRAHHDSDCVPALLARAKAAEEALTQQVCAWCKAPFDRNDYAGIDEHMRSCEKRNDALGRQVATFRATIARLEAELSASRTASIDLCVALRDSQQLASSRGRELETLRKAAIKVLRGPFGDDDATKLARFDNLVALEREVYPELGVSSAAPSSETTPTRCVSCGMVDAARTCLACGTAK